MSADRNAFHPAAVDPVHVYAEARRLRAEAIHAAFAALGRRLAETLARGGRRLPSAAGRA